MRFFIIAEVIVGKKKNTTEPYLDATAQPGSPKRS